MQSKISAEIKLIVFLEQQQLLVISSVIECIKDHIFELRGRNF